MRWSGGGSQCCKRSARSSTRWSSASPRTPSPPRKNPSHPKLLFGGFQGKASQLKLVSLCKRRLLHAALRDGSQAPSRFLASQAQLAARVEGEQAVVEALREDAAMLRSEHSRWSLPDRLAAVSAATDSAAAVGWGG